MNRTSSASVFTYLQMLRPVKLKGDCLAKLAGVILIGLGLTSCNQGRDFTPENLDLKYLLIRRSGAMDTIYRKIEHWTTSDSFAIISYKERSKNDDDPYETTYKFAMKRELDSLTHFRLVDTARFELDETTYLILKYLFDDKNADDEEMLYFYSPELGVLIFKSAWWGNYERLLISDDRDKDRIVFYLIEMIANNDNEFFYSWCEECR